jgi:hypothetical protein
MSPFVSDAQRKFLYAKHPGIAKRWSKEYPNQGDLPEHVKKSRKRWVASSDGKYKVS